MPRGSCCSGSKRPDGRTHDDSTGKAPDPAQAQRSFPIGPGGKAGGPPANRLPLGAGHRPAGGGKAAAPLPPLRRHGGEPAGRRARPGPGSGGARRKASLPVSPGAGVGRRQSCGECVLLSRLEKVPCPLSFMRTGRNGATGAITGAAVTAASWRTETRRGWPYFCGDGPGCGRAPPPANRLPCRLAGKKASPAGNAAAENAAKGSDRDTEGKRQRESPSAVVFSPLMGRSPASRPLPPSGCGGGASGRSP